MKGHLKAEPLIHWRQENQSAHCRCLHSPASYKTRADTAPPPRTPAVSESVKKDSFPRKWNLLYLLPVIFTSVDVQEQAEIEKAERWKGLQELKWDFEADGIPFLVALWFWRTG